jgi:hypothetical protein
MIFPISKQSAEAAGTAGLISCHDQKKNATVIDLRNSEKQSRG